MCGIPVVVVGHVAEGINNTVAVVDIVRVKESEEIMDKLLYTTLLTLSVYFISSKMSNSSYMANIITINCQ